jgi:preprotein translocase subunit SecA
MVETELLEIMSGFLDGTAPEDRDIEGMLGELHSIFPVKGSDRADPDVLAPMDRQETEKILLDLAREMYEKQEAGVSPELMRAIEREIMLRTIDANWVPHLTSMENLRQGIGLHAYGQRDPLVMYKKEGMEMFESLKARIQYDIVHTIYHVRVDPGSSDGKSKGPRPNKPLGDEKSVMTRVMGNRSGVPVTSGARKVGRNQPCPCGSGKKYKRCHGT